MLYRVNRYGKNVYIGFGSKIVCGKSVTLHSKSCLMPYTMLLCHKGSNLVIGEGTEIGMFSRITCAGKITLGKEIITGPNIFISDHNHRYDIIGIPIKQQGILTRKTKNENDSNISIGDGSWLGANVVIIGNVKIGKGSVVGANSVVTKDIPDYSVAVGNPCRIIKSYNSATLNWEKATNS